MIMERLDKYLSAQTTLSRRDATAAIRRGRVTVNGIAVRDPAQKLDPAIATVTLDGQAVAYHRYVYILLNKPAGILCVSRDPKTETVVDLLPDEWRTRGLFPAGRLDKDTTGMVLLTDDGDYAHRMLAPKKHVPKRYLATLDAPADQAVCDAFKNGMTLANGEVCLPADCELAEGCNAVVTLHEGKYHQVKRMFAACGRHVERLHRLSMGGLPLDESLAPGEYRLLTEEEAMTVFL
ncbi:MAG: rRNA pseudouridine synthase [Ruminococcaceae bacterium]|nr:rRNA pseudouridine synthase [Oscillospiraceae bacterium]